MESNEPRPFLASQRREVLASLAEGYIRGTHASIVERVGAALDPLRHSAARARKERRCGVCDPDRESRHIG